MKQIQNKLPEKISLPFKLFTITILSIFLSSLFVNIIPFLHTHSSNIYKITEASLITIFLIPELYYLFYRPLKSYVEGRQKAEDDLKNLNRNLEDLVNIRTGELTRLNKLLEEEYTESLRLSEEKYKNVIDSIGVGITLISPNMKILSINSHVKRCFPNIDFSKNPICYQTFVDPPRESACDGCPVTLTFDDGKVHESTLDMSWGQEKRVNKVVSSPLKDKNGIIIGAVTVVEDITQRKQSENALRDLNENLEQKIKERSIDLEKANKELEREIEDRIRAEKRMIKSRDFYLTLFENFPALIWRSGTNGKCNYFNKTWLQFTGKNLEEEIGDGWTQGLHPEDSDYCLKTYLSAFQKRVPFRMEYRLRRYDGQYRWILDRGRPFYDIDNQFAGYIGSCYDVTENYEAQEALIDSEERYRSLIRQSSEGVIVFEPSTRIIQEANTQICDMLGYEENEIVGQKLEKITTMNLSFLKSDFEKMIRKGEKIFGLRQYRHKNGSRIEAEVSASLIRFGKDKVVLANIRNVTERRKAEEALKESIANLKMTLNETVNALVAVAEKRDPYTAGHQHRVAVLACAIAEEMGLPQKQIEGILVASKLHDIGKIYVPNEILNKPGRLTDMEMGIIKSHPNIGYEILEKIPFECPVAKVVFQHHEKLDGSGYPLGLLGDEILIEAKILCVADVVEAMASHRPYRPALGVYKAIEEIIKNRGVLYEVEVVDACLKVIHSIGFELFRECYEEISLVR